TQGGETRKSMNWNSLLHPNRRLALASMTCVAALSNACAVASPDDGGFQEGSVSDDLSDYSKERDLQLIGGTQAAPYHFRSTVQLRFPGIGACTGAKVGPRHFLTAAHCIADDAGQS